MGMEGLGLYYYFGTDYFISIRTIFLVIRLYLKFEYVFGAPPPESFSLDSLFARKLPTWVLADLQP